MENHTSPALNLYLALNKQITSMNRKFHPGLDGVGFTEFAILLSLSQQAEHKMRRIDLAETMGLTASGITRILLPMEKLGLVKRESSDHDARVSYVVITESGLRNVTEKLPDAVAMAESLFPPALNTEIARLSESIRVQK